MLPQSPNPVAPVSIGGKTMIDFRYFLSGLGYRVSATGIGDRFSVYCVAVAVKITGETNCAVAVTVC